MRKIAMISEHASPLALLGGVDSGGQNVYVAQIAKHLGRMGVEVDIFTRRDNPLLPEIVDYAENVRVINVPAGPACFIRKEDLLPYMKEFSRSTFRFMSGEETPYDLVHAHFWMSGLVAAELKRALGIPFVVTFHALGRIRRIYQRTRDGFPECRVECEKQVAAEADLVIAECPQDREDLMLFYGMSPEKIEMIPCGFDPAEFWPIEKEEAREALGFSPEEKIVLQLGRMVPRKGVDTVLRAFSLMTRFHSIDAKLLIVGGESGDPWETPEVVRLAALAKKEGVGEKVIFKGAVPRAWLKYYYSAADIFVSTPWYEPFGITPVEAMACGTPVIGSRVGGIQYTVVDGETGFLIEPRDISSLAYKMAELYRHPLLALSFGKKAEERVNELFQWSQVAESMARMYEEIESHPKVCAPLFF